MKILLLVLFLGFLFFGCLQSVGGDEYTSQYAQGINERIAISDPDQIEACEIGNCYCMVCKNGSTLWGTSMNNLIGGNCYLEKDCKSETANEIRNKTATPDLAIREFMLGQGPTISDFASANKYCTFKLKMAVEWLIGNEDEPYKMPDAGRAFCLLSREVMPVYILYSEGKNINIAQSRQIGEYLATEGANVWEGGWSDGPVGPNIVVAEIDFNATDADQVAQQIIAINEGCKNDRSVGGTLNCWVAVSPKIGDKEALDAVMAQVGDQVDVVAFGVNGQYADACISGRIAPIKMMNQIVNFSEYALYVHGKPSLIPYILLDLGSKDKNGCVWKESDIAQAYAAFLPKGVHRLREKGLIGMAPYSFNSSNFGSIANPLKCVNCAVASHEQWFRAYYGGCQAYTNITSPMGDYGSYGNEILFPNASGGFCDFGGNLDSLFRETSFRDVGGNKDYLNPRAPEIRPVSDINLFSCSSCLISNFSPTTHYSFGGAAVGSVDPNSEHFCLSYQDEIAAWANARNLDPILVRAFALIESNLTADAAARVCDAGVSETGSDGRGCFEPGGGKDECYNAAYRVMFNPSSFPDPRDKYGGEFSNAPEAEDLGTDPDWKWCGLGFMQSLEPPYTFWPASVSPTGEDGEYAWACEDANICDEDLLKIARGCAAEVGGNFNPFNVTHSLCMGTYKMAQGLEMARGIVRQNEELFGVSGSNEKSELMAAYIMAQMYGGSWGYNSNNMRIVSGVLPPCASNTQAGACFIDKFKANKEVDKEYCEQDPLPFECEDYGEPKWDPPEFCYGEKDPTVFWDSCIQPFLTTPNNHGNAKMKQFFALQSCSSNPCPDGKTQLELVCRDDGSGKVDPNLCDGIGRPKIPQSGTYYSQN